MSSWSGALGLSGLFRGGKKSQKIARGSVVLSARSVARGLVAAGMALVVAGCTPGRGGNASGGFGRTLNGISISAEDIGRSVSVDPRGGQAIVAVLAPVGSPNNGVAAIGASLDKAAKLAARDIGDPSLVVRVYDTAGTPAGAQQAAQQAISDGAAIIVGPLFSQSVQAAAPIAARRGVPMLAFSTDINVAGGNVFLTGILMESEIDRMIGYAASQGVASMGVLAPSTTQGEVAMRALQASAGRYGVQIVAGQRYKQDFKGIEAGAKAYAETHKRLADFAPVQAIFLADSGQALQSASAYLAYYDISPQETKFMGAGIWASTSTLKEAALRGGWFAAPDPKPRDAFAKRYAEAYGGQPHSLAALSYDSVAAAGAMLAEARSRGDRYPFTIDAITASTGFGGVNGVYRLRRDGLNDRGLAILEVGKKGFKVIDAAPTAFAGY